MQIAFTLLTLTGPLALIAAFAVSRFDPGLRPERTHLAAAVAGIVSLVAAISGLAGLLLAGPFTWAAGAGVLQILSLRLDVLSVTMFLLVSFIGCGGGSLQPQLSGRRSAAGTVYRMVVPRARRDPEIRAVPDPWLADRSDGNAHAGLRAAACGRHQCRWVPADPLRRRHAARARACSRSGDAGRLHGALSAVS
jgi:hypothetical protein